jgi:hypothetical protein
MFNSKGLALFAGSIQEIYEKRALRFLIAVPLSLV